MKYWTPVEVADFHLSFLETERPRKQGWHTTWLQNHKTHLQLGHNQLHTVKHCRITSFFFKATKSFFFFKSYWLDQHCLIGLIHALGSIHDSFLPFEVCPTTDHHSGLVKRCNLVHHRLLHNLWNLKTLTGLSQQTEAEEQTIVVSTDCHIMPKIGVKVMQSNL